MSNDMNDQQRQKVDAEIAHLLAQTAWINRQNLFYPVIVTATGTLAVVAVLNIFLT